MSDKTRELLDQIYRLPRTDRALIAIEAAVSLEEDDPAGVEQAWAEEIAKRVEQVMNGSAQSIPVEESLARARARVAEIRRRRHGEASQSA